MKRTLSCLSLFPLLLASCGEARASYNEVVFGFDTTSLVRLSNATETCFNDIVDVISRLSRYLDPYTSDPEVTIEDINKTNEPLEVDPLLAEALQFALEMEEESEGYFRVLIGGVSKIWKRVLNDYNHVLPSQEVIDDAVAEMNASSLKIEGNIVTRTGNATIDAGAFAKGFALKKIQEIIARDNLKTYVVNCGTSSILLGETGKKEKPTYTLDFYDVEPRTSYEASNTAIGNSGIYEQCFEKGGATYSHLINPLTGSAKVEGEYGLVTLNGPDGAVLDVLSTVFYLRGECEATRALAAKYGISYAFQKMDGSWDSHGITFNK